MIYKINFQQETTWPINLFIFAWERFSESYRSLFEMFKGLNLVIFSNWIIHYFFSCIPPVNFLKQDPRYANSLSNFIENWKQMAITVSYSLDIIWTINKLSGFQSNYYFLGNISVTTIFSCDYLDQIYRFDEIKTLYVLITVGFQ